MVANLQVIHFVLHESNEFWMLTKYAKARRDNLGFTPKALLNLAQGNTLGKTGAQIFPTLKLSNKLRPL